MTSTAGRSGSVQTSRRSSPAPSRRSGRSSRTQTARTTRPLRKRAATRQLRYRATSSLPYGIRALRWTGSASTRSGVIRGPYLRGRPRRRRRGGRGTAYSARSRRARPITVWPSASAASISRARMNQASSRTRARPSRWPSRRSRKRALLSLPRLVPRRTRRSISGTAPTRQPRSTTAARHSQPWPRRNRDRFGLPAWLRCRSEPGGRAEIRSTTVSSMTTCQTGGANSSFSTPSSARPTASHAQRPRCRNQEELVQLRDSPAARIASVTWPPRVVAAPSSSSVKVVRARRGTASARPATREVRIGGTAVVGIGRSQRGWARRCAPRCHPQPIAPATAPGAPAPPPRSPRRSPPRAPRHAHRADRVPVNFSFLIPGSRNADRWREPREVGERTEASRLRQEGVPGRTSRVHHGLVAAGEHAVAEPAVAQVLPHPLDRVELRAVGRRVDQGQVRRHGQVVAHVPAGPVEHQRGVGPGRHGRRQLGEEEVHGGGRDLGQDQRDTLAALGTDRAEQVGGAETLLPHAARAHAFLVPDVGDAALQADARLVHEPELDPLAGVPARDRLDQAGQVFLNRSRAFGSASGWTGRAFCQERSSPCSSRLTPLSL